MRERERGRRLDGGRGTDIDKHRDRETETGKRETQRETNRQRQGERYTERNKQTETGRERYTERNRER